jgi:hypothetical protein
VLASGEATFTGYVKLDDTATFLALTDRVLASQSALLYGFALWGGVKELYAAAFVALVAATLPLVRRRAGTGLPCAIAAAATILALSPGAVVWLLAPLVALLQTRSRGVLVACLGAPVLAFPAFAVSGSFLRADNRASFRDDGELGNLVRPLDPAQLLGIWPTGDFRLSPSDARGTALVLGITLAAASLGLLFALARRAGPFVLYVASCVIGAVAFSALGSPWLEAKAFAAASPGFLLLALVGGAKLLEHRRPVALVALATIAGGVCASNALAYRDARLAPREQLLELEQIGRRFAGEGPALMTEYQPYGVRHFLRTRSTFALRGNERSGRPRSPPCTRGGRTPAAGRARGPRFSGATRGREDPESSRSGC